MQNSNENWLNNTKLKELICYFFVVLHKLHYIYSVRSGMDTEQEQSTAVLCVLYQVYQSVSRSK
jgi:hypothetical protein